MAPRAEARRRSRLDTHYLCTLTGALEGVHREKLRVSPNSALYASADQLRYAEGRVDPETRARRNHLVSIERTPAIDAALERARGGALPSEVARSVATALDDVTDDEVRVFVDELIASQVLVSDSGLALDEVCERVGAAVGPLTDLVKGQT